MLEGVTISKAAAFAGITVKAVRHYHKIGLVDDPGRDSSGYRRYGSKEILQLIKIRTLAASGVPLSKIRPLLTHPEDNVDTLVDIEHHLEEHIKDLTRQRHILQSLIKGDQILLPNRAIAILKRAAELGFTSEEIASTREGFILAKALFPNSFNNYIDSIEYALSDSAFIALIRQSWEAITWKPDDPRIETLATALADHMLADPKLLTIFTTLESSSNQKHELISKFGAGQSSSWPRLNAFFTARLTSAGVHIEMTDHRTKRRNVEMK